ncbi:hypothetical protein LR48_Vigan11g057600 [Vigna angularis]|uniref:Uncharacterized protein n=1 Tax=Phaseolus angularis TaxID=3914 RepID=A0A0L9VRH1_PHAAN|nr:hypothetical protein LR48_Vigan11g057600 [Vigna angularis]
MREMESEKESKSAKGEAEGTAQRHFTVERHSEGHGRKHEKHFRVVQDRRLLMERKVGMIPNFAPQFGEQVLGNDWGNLATYLAPANIAVVKEFYTNAKKIGDYPAENYLGYVNVGET